MSGGDWKEMLVAVQDGNINLVKYHIESGIDVNYEHPELMTTALIESVNYDRIEIAKYLLENGADPHLTAWMSSDSPMSLAKQNRKKEFIQLLSSYSRSKRNFLRRLFNLGY